MNLVVFRRAASLSAIPLLLFGCTPSKPPLAAGLTSEQFQTHVETLFPKGSDGEALRRTLEVEGFNIRSEPYAGSYMGHQAAFWGDSIWRLCTRTFKVRWITDSSNRIENVRAWHYCDEKL
jgi:hypothetical protein